MKARYALSLDEFCRHVERMEFAIGRWDPDLVMIPPAYELCPDALIYRWTEVRGLIKKNCINVDEMMGPEK